MTHPTHLVIRQEDWASVAPAALLARDDLVPRWVAFRRELFDLLAHWFPGPVHAAPIAPQLATAASWKARGEVLSLDAMVPHVHELYLCRRYASDGLTFLDLGPRPGHPALQTQIAALPRTDWILLDDDIHSGATMALVRGALEQAGHTVTREVPLLPPHPTGEPREILDSRDFLLGTRSGGLVIEQPGGTFGRLPYLLPFTRPAVRASLPSEADVPVSLALWRANAAFFEGTDIRLRDLDADTTRSLRARSIDLTTPAARWCREMAGRLTP